MNIDNLSKSFGKTIVFENFSLSVKKDSIVCLTGPSGCGKTTLLNIIAGLEKQDGGSIEIEGDKRISYLFQEPRLLDNLTVLKNVSVPLRGNKTKAKQMLELVGLSDCIDKYPSQLSGGQRQRVAIARAFCFPSSLILMDEPFQNLDVKMKNNLVKVFLDIWQQNKKTVLWVTHDITEACFAADKIICLSSKPMKIEKSFSIREKRSERTTESIAAVSASVYKTLVK